MTRAGTAAFTAVLFLFGGTYLASGGEISRSFEFRYVTNDTKAPVVLNLGEEKTVSLTVEVRNVNGKVAFTKKFENVHLPEGRTVTTLSPFTPKKLKPGYYAV